MLAFDRPDCASLCPMAHIACVLPVPGRPNASTLYRLNNDIYNGRSHCLNKSVT